MPSNHYSNPSPSSDLPPFYSDNIKPDPFSLSKTIPQDSYYQHSSNYQAPNVAEVDSKQAKSQRPFSIITTEQGKELPQVATTKPNTASNTTTYTTGSMSDNVAGDTLSIHANISSGTFISPQEVELVLKLNGQEISNSKVYYCLSYETTCCNPKQSPTLYTAPILVGEINDGLYCLSFYGSYNNSFDTDIASLKITIDSTPLPPLSLDPTHLYLQSTQKFSFLLPKVAYSGLTEPALIFSLHHSLLDPGSDPDCKQLFLDNNALDLSGDNVSDYFDFNDYLANTYSIFPFYYFPVFDYGENYIIPIVRKFNDDAALYSCTTLNVTINDFDFFSTLPINTATSTSSTKLIGGFQSYGYFLDPSTTTQTTGKNTNQGLHSEYMGTIY